MFPKFIKVSKYMRYKTVHGKKTAFGSEGIQTTTIMVDVTTETTSGIYVPLSSIVECSFREETSEWHIVASNSVRPMYGIVTDPDQMAILEGYVTTAHMDSNHDIITAISDMKEFMCHLATVTSEESLKRKRDV